MNPTPHSSASKFLSATFYRRFADRLRIEIGDLRLPDAEPSDDPAEFDALVQRNRAASFAFAYVAMVDWLAVRDADPHRDLYATGKDVYALEALAYSTPHDADDDFELAADALRAYLEFLPGYQPAAARSGAPVEASAVNKHAFQCMGVPCLRDTTH